eukprot:scaffold21013_cov63-Phaeocystis_antarctica.AAC.7
MEHGAAMDGARGGAERCDGEGRCHLEVGDGARWVLEGIAPQPQPQLKVRAVPRQRHLGHLIARGRGAVHACHTGAIVRNELALGLDGRVCAKHEAAEVPLRTAERAAVQSERGPTRGGAIGRRDARDGGRGVVVVAAYRHELLTVEGEVEGHVRLLERPATLHLEAVDAVRRAARARARAEAEAPAGHGGPARHRGPLEER